MQIVWSDEPETICLPSGEKAAQNDNEPQEIIPRIDLDAPPGKHFNRLQNWAEYSLQIIESSGRSANADT